MQKRPLGASGISIAPLALGGNVFGWTIDQAASFKVLDAFVDFGFDLIDTANMYSAWVPGNQGGESETIIGNWLKASGKRDRVVIATKVGMKMGDGTQGLKRDYILQSAEASLRRLQTDHIDLYQSHRDDADTPLEETLSAYDQLIKSGKVRAIGASNYDAARLAEALRVSAANNLPAYVSLQPEYNLYDRKVFEAALEPLCLEKKIGVINYYSLAAGFLTGKYRSPADLGKSARGAGIGKKYLNDRGTRILAALDAVAAAQRTVPAVVALAWLMQRPAVTAPIASATSVDQLSQLAKATQLKLTAEEVKKLDAASAE
jgi:aryl-alcohol dehydrogenase-like predicted oxidoreductase